MNLTARITPIAFFVGLVLLASLVLGTSLVSAAAPALTIENASEVGFTAAKVEGTIDPQGQPSAYRFQYVTDARFQENLANFLPGFEGAGTGIEAGTETAESLSGQLTGLSAGTTYHLRLQAENGDGQENAVAATTFTTQSATAPTLAVEPATGVSFTKAHISATIDPEGGNVNPAGDAVPLFWQLQFTRDPINEGWQFAEAGAIEGAEAESNSPITVAKDLEGLVNATEYKVRLVVSYAGKGAIPAEGSFVTETVTAPLVEADDATAVTGASAHFSGHVTAGNADPAFDSFCEFDYVTQKQFEAGEFDNPGAGHIACDEPNPVTGPGATAVSADPVGLVPHTVYHLRLRAQNQSAGGPVTDVAPSTFETEALPPAIGSTGASEVTPTSATLNAVINPGAAATTYHFEYLTLAEYEAQGEGFSTATATPESASIGADNQGHPAQATIAGLQPDTDYRFRAVATNAKSGPGGTAGPVRSFHTRVAPVVETDNCPNATLRAENNSLALPDCRAYELVTPDANHANLLPQSALAAPDGDMMVYQAMDAPEHANSGQPLHNYVRARRDPVQGWSSVGLSPPLSAPAIGYFTAAQTYGISADLSSTFEISDQPLSGEGTTSVVEQTFVGRSDGSYQFVASAKSLFLAGTPDYSHVYFQPYKAQLPSDPLAALNTYVWSEDRGLRLIGILPDETPAPNGVSFAGASDDGKYVAFVADGKLYLRIDDHETVEIGASQRTVEPDPNPASTPSVVDVTSDGSKVLFTSPSELTNDANTGNSGGVATDAGRDLYSYDVATGKLTDLTVDTNPADMATGTNIQTDVFGRLLVRATPDGSVVYFVASGVLADGATPGHRSLYVWHDGRIDFVADADGMFSNLNVFAPYYFTPDGQHIAFVSTDPLTGYDNTDPVTGQPHTQVFTATIGEAIECASCRADGARPTGDSSLSQSVVGHNRVMSDDGRRLFFESTDAVVAGAPGGQNQVFEYASGKASPISRPDGPEALLLDVSASGDDVFFLTYDDQLVPNPNNGDATIFDARVGGGFPTASRGACAADACPGPQSAPPQFDQPGSRHLTGYGNQLASRACKKGRVRKGGRCVKRHAHGKRSKQRHEKSRTGPSGGVK